MKRIIFFAVMIFASFFPLACQNSFNLTPLAVPSPTNTPTFTPTAVGKMVSTLAGQYRSPGSANGTGTAASFSTPWDVAVDNAGNVYVADGYILIRKITPGGVVTTLAGSGAVGFTNATGTAASFNGAYGVAADSSGNVYVADSGNHAIRKITPGGVVTTLAGSGSPGAVNAAGTLASFNSPNAVAVDSAGNVYVADSNNNLIRMITPGGVVTTVAGSGLPGAVNATGTAASFNNPLGVAVDSSGNLYVADNYNGMVRKITPGGVVTTLAGSGMGGFTNGTGTAASFQYLDGIAVDSSGNVYVADSGNDVIRAITPGGVVTTFAGGSTSGLINGPALSVDIAYPAGVAVSSTGIVYVALESDSVILKIQ